jgi:hypothetical protein
MTERKPTGVTFESWVERQIREAAERGEFDDLPGAGKPLPGLHEPYDELWWIKEHVRREGLSTEALLPTPLQLRKEIERLSETVRGLSSEESVRDVVRELNQRIVAEMRAPSGPRVHLGPVDVEKVVTRWRADRREVPERVATTAPPEEIPRRRGRWWRRLTGRC